MFPTPRIATDKIPECKPRIERGDHRRLYRFSAQRLSGAGCRLHRTSPETGEDLVVFDEAPEGVPPVTCRHSPPSSPPTTRRRRLPKSPSSCASAPACPADRTGRRPQAASKEIHQDRDIAREDRLALDSTTPPASARMSFSPARPSRPTTSSLVYGLCFTGGAEAVTGPKADFWLVRTVGITIAAIGADLSARRGSISDDMVQRPSWPPRSRCSRRGARAARHDQPGVSPRCRGGGILRRRVDARVAAPWLILLLTTDRAGRLRPAKPRTAVRVPQPPDPVASLLA